MEWIKVSDRLPIYDEFVLFVVNDIGCLTIYEKVTYYLGWINSAESLNTDKDEWFADGIGEWFPTKKVTHWMPLPKPPTE